MNINRLLSRREKDGSSHKRQKSRDKSSDKKARPLSSEGIISLFKPDPQKKLNKEQEKEQDSKMQTIKQRMQDHGHTNIDDEQISYALLSKHADGDVDRAFELVLLFQESVEGVIKPYNPTIEMKGAENRGNVTCYLDALLFAMFARLGSFEPILYTRFEDEPRRRLSTLIRLWVNMLRTGKLIQTDITGYLQDALVACGWADAGKLEQQDTSEAFSFITEKLELPLLTLKMDIYHTGTEDDKDDHKFIHERLLEVAVPPDPGNGRPIQLEDCLENFFNNRVEVVRRLERSNTVSSVRSNPSTSVEKATAQHVEISEVSWSAPETPTSAQDPGTPSTPSTARHRAGSVIRHRMLTEEERGESSTDTDALSTRDSIRKGSVRKEVLMPAWQFFNLIPWYTKSSPANNAEVAAHFSQTRPVLGICLKRYVMSLDGQASRKNTFIDIPLDIRLPHFIDDDMIPEEGPLMGNFKLSLQSVICHRGNSLHAGHYVSFIRAAAEVADGDSTSSRRLSDSSRPPHYQAERWIRHDDLGIPERVQYVDIEQALKDEMPYLLFYQVQPTYDITPPPGLDCEPPLYDSGIDVRISESSPLHIKPEQSYFDGARDESTPALRFSAELERPTRHSVNLPDERRGSLAHTELSIGSAASSIRVPEVTSTPATPSEEKPSSQKASAAEETTAQRLSRAASRFARNGSRSRPTSSSGENRISATFSRMAMRSKDQLSKGEPKTDASKESVATVAATILSTDGTIESHEASVTIVEEDENIKPKGETPKRAKSRLGRKRDKSREPAETIEKVANGQHHHAHFHKGKGKDIPDRECMIM